MDNSWQEKMYDPLVAAKTLNTETMALKADKEVGFLLSKLMLPKEAKILDIPCGTGRHSQVLASMGFQVTGVDISPACLAIAQDRTALSNLHYELGDMKDLSSYEGEYDCVLNLFSSFGYFSSDEENEDALAQMITALRPGGKLVLNLINREFLLSIYKPAFWFRSEGVLTVNAGSYDPKSHYNESYMTIKDETTGETSLSYHRMRLYSAVEIQGMMKKYGLNDIEVYGDAEGALFDMKKSSHPFYIGTKVSE